MKPMVKAEQLFEQGIAAFNKRDYQLSLAIGKDGQNARLAARLTGWRIDIHPDNPVVTNP